FKNLSNLIPALLTGNFDYFTRIVQWVTIPRHLILGVIILFGVGTCFFNWVLCLKWWLLFFIYCFALAVALPNYLVNENFNKSMRTYALLSLQLVFHFLNPINKR
ncbi:MAG: glycosyltransferase family 2 protein, partial [Phocaeicola sp.]